ncbi:MAG: small acid-soluble spore protein Tlp [Clostridiales bacterium]|nr:small acid-soluble spore protein Tlp [Clostridiales bacterium]
MNNKPDDRSDNVKKIQNSIDRTIRNMELAEEMIAVTSDPGVKQQLIDKNSRRKHALDGLRREIKDESDFLRKKS